MKTNTIILYHLWNNRKEKTISFQPFFRQTIHLAKCFQTTNKSGKQPFFYCCFPDFLRVIIELCGEMPKLSVLDLFRAKIIVYTISDLPERLQFKNAISCHVRIIVCAIPPCDSSP